MSELFPIYHTGQPKLAGSYREAGKRGIEQCRKAMRVDRQAYLAMIDWAIAEGRLRYIGYIPDPDEIIEDFPDRPEFTQITIPGI